MNVPRYRTGMELQQDYDQQRQLDREGQDEYLNEMQLGPGSPAAMNTPAVQFNRMQEDGATGLNGFNRQWVPLMESLRGMKVRQQRGEPSIADDPMSTFNTNSTFAGSDRLDSAVKGLQRKR